MVVAVERDNCVLECEPLSWWEPNDFSEVLLVQDFVEVTMTEDSYARRLYLIGLGVGVFRIVPLSWSLFLLLALHFKFFRVA